MIARSAGSAAVTVLLWLAPRPADACIPVFTRAIVEPLRFEPPAGATVVSEVFDVVCDARACTVHGKLQLRVSTRTEVHVASTDALALTIDGVARSSRWLEPSDAATPLDVVIQLPLPVYRADACEPPGITARHPWLAAAPAGTARVLELPTVRTRTVTHPARWSLHVDARTDDRWYGRQPRALTRLWFRPSTRRLSHGGPMLLAGAGGQADGWHLRPGYELQVLWPWMVAAVTADTDLASIHNAALTLEAVTPAGYFLPFTASVGAGAIVSTRRDPELGARLQLGIGVGLVRVALGLDLLPADVLPWALAGVSI